MFTAFRALGFYGDDGIRTRDLCVANATLSQLSYVPATSQVYLEADWTSRNISKASYLRPRKYKRQICIF